MHKPKCRLYTKLSQRHWSKGQDLRHPSERWRRFIEICPYSVFDCINNLIRNAPVTDGCIVQLVVRDVIHAAVLGLSPSMSTCFSFFVPKKSGGDAGVETESIYNIWDTSDIRAQPSTSGSVLHFVLPRAKLPYS